MSVTERSPNPRERKRDENRDWKPDHKEDMGDAGRA
jgi:hypothetical protein